MVLRVCTFASKWGEVLWDRFPSGEQFGVAPANFSCPAAIHGAEVSMLSAVGEDKPSHD
jgi:sugar/nucleoside kinase (ribokinase family)